MSIRGWAVLWTLCLSNAASAQAVSERAEFVACMADKQVANALVRLCSRWEQVALDQLFSGLAPEQLEHFRERLEAIGGSLAEVELYPYRCLFPPALAGAPQANEDAIMAEVEARTAHLVDGMEAAHGYVLADDFSDMTEEQACTIIDGQLETDGELYEALAEYGLE